VSLGVAPLQSPRLGQLLLQLLLPDLAIVHLEQHAGRTHKGVFHALASLRRGLKEPVQALFARELLTLGRGNFSLLLLIFFVGHEENQCVRLRLILNLLEPVGEVHEGVHAGQVVGEQHGMGPAVKDLGD